MTIELYDISIVINNTQKQDKKKHKRIERMVHIMRRKNILITGLVVAAVTVAGVSSFAAEDIVEDTKEVIERGSEFFRGGKAGNRAGRNMESKSQIGGFENAVEEGILTETEVEAIEAYREANAPDMESLKAAMEDMTREEMMAYKEENFSQSTEHTEDLVEAGLISQTQADALEALREDAQANRPDRAEFDGERSVGMKGAGRQGKGQKSYDAAVEAGILSEDDLAALEAYREANAPDMEAIKAELEDMTKEEAKAYMEENYPKSEDHMADLVAQGLLTQDQVDQLEVLREEAEANRPDRSEFDGERPEGMEGRGGMRSGRGQRPGSEETPAEETSL